MHPRRTHEVLLVLAAALALSIPGGCAKKDSGTNPQTGPTAGFTATPRSGIRPLDVDFTDQSIPGTSGITSGMWSFGDGTPPAPWPSTGHLYGAAGTYTVSLTVTTAVGSDAEIKTNYVMVTDGPTPPTAAFSGTPTAGAAPLSVQFTDQSLAGSSPITAWAWTFGDGGTSVSQSPSHTYTANGTYSVSLTVTTSDGNNTNTKSGYIVVSSPVPPTAEFSGTPTGGTAPLTVQFTDASTAGSALITGRSWSFGDGTANSTATNPSHTYTSAGTYTVALTVSSASGNDTNTKTNYITVSTTPVPPTAQFSGTPTSGPAPLSVQFTDQSIAGSAPITSRSWSFGDGTPNSTDTNPSHSYTSPGTYTVSLTVTTSVGSNTQTKTGYIQVCEPLVVNFTGAPVTGLAPLLVVFANLSTGATSYSWDFGDGTAASTAQNPSHTYMTPGTYDVRLIARNACGADSTTKVGYITVADPCPNPVYTVVSALWDNKDDKDKDGYFNRARLRWNADVTPTTCTRSVFAKIYYRVTGETPWALLGQSSCYTIIDARGTDYGNFTVNGLPQACYDFRIVLFECEGTTEEAILEPAGDPADLTNQCFEP